MTRWARWMVGLASVVLFTVSLLWALVTPGLRGADEGAHLDSVVRLAEGGGWPRPGTVRYEDEIRDVEVLAGSVHDHLRTVFPRTTSFVPEAPAFPDLVPPAPDERLSLHALDDGVAPGGPVDQMTQHPPGYYALAAALYDLTGAGDWRYDSALLLLRAFTALMVAAALPICCFLVARDLTGSEAAGALAAVVPLFVPQLHFVAGTVTNDGATVAATAVVWALLVRVLCAGPSRRRLLVLALAVGASCWTKGTALSLLPAVVLAVGVGYRRQRGPRLRAWGPPALGATAGVLAGACALGGWWWVVNLVRYGSLQPSGYELPEGEFGPFGFLEFAGVFVRRIRWNFFLEVGGREPPDVDGLTAALAVGFAVLTLAGVVALRRTGDRAVLLVGVVLTSGLLLHTTYTAHLSTHGLPGIQGRYLYVLLVPIAALMAAALAQLGAAIRLPARGLTAAGAAGGVAVALLGLGLGLRVFYGRPDDSWPDAVDRFLGWAAWPPGGVALLLALALLAGLALVVAAALVPRPRPVDTRSGVPAEEPELRITESAERT